ncbi:MAG: LytTR family DNA-binding domain-containing protein [Bacteroidia bacterium]|jgi:two-component system LytT family response regulator
MRIVILEDEGPALTRIQNLVREIVPDIDIAGSADSIVSAIDLFSKTKDIDLALMDIELADGQSFEIFTRIKIPCPVIFTTAYDEYALKAFKLNSIDYLLKPIDKKEMQKAFDKFRYLHGKGQPQQSHIESLLANLSIKQQNHKTRFLVKAGTKLLSISTDEIAYFHAIDKAVWLHTRDNRKYPMDQSLDEINKKLDPLCFFQLNRQFLTHFQSIQQIHTYFNGKLKVELKPEMTEEVIVSRERAPEFKQWLDR